MRNLRDGDNGSEGGGVFAGMYSGALEGAKGDERQWSVSFLSFRNN
jgi:hypothetical protein